MDFHTRRVVVHTLLALWEARNPQAHHHNPGEEAELRHHNRRPRLAHVRGEEARPCTEDDRVKV